MVKPAISTSEYLGIKQKSIFSRCSYNNFSDSNFCMKNLKNTVKEDTGGGFVTAMILNNRVMDPFSYSSMGAPINKTRTADISGAGFFDVNYKNIKSEVSNGK